MSFKYFFSILKHVYIIGVWLQGEDQRMCVNNEHDGENLCIQSTNMHFQ